jgi:periplasmic divalent cation tolerance protein
LENVYLQVFTAVEKREDAELIARTVLEEKLAGCVQIVGPIASTYWWNGALESSEEWLCIIKSERSLYPELERSIKRVHAYEVPEIIALSINMGNGDYFRWLDSTITKKKGRTDTP